MLLFPPVPKIYFASVVRVDNTNDIPVTMERFRFQIAKIRKNHEPIPLADVASQKSLIISAHESKNMELEFVTKFEENTDSELLIFVKDLLKAWLTSQDLEILLKGDMEFTTIFGTMNIPISKTTNVRLGKK